MGIFLSIYLFGKPLNISNIGVFCSIASSIYTSCKTMSAVASAKSCYCIDAYMMYSARRFWLIKTAISSKFTNMFRCNGGNFPSCLNLQYILVQKLFWILIKWQFYFWPVCVDMLMLRFLRAGNGHTQSNNLFISLCLKFG